MSFFNKSVEISICIPVFRTEKYLKACLESFTHQKLPEGLKSKNFFELVIVDDASDGGAESIVKEFRKSVDFPVQYIRHSENKGVFEVRRTALYEAKGRYIIFADSDDLMVEDGVYYLYKKAVESGADIVHGHTSISFFENEETLFDNNTAKLEKLRQTRYEQANMLAGVLNGREVFDGYLVDGKHNGFLWAKIFRKELVLNAFEHIPPVFCNHGTDFLLYFWLTFEAKSYVPLENVVYNYFINSGITSNKEVKDMERWRKICSTAGLFTALYEELEQYRNELSDAESNAIAGICKSYVYNNLQTWRYAVMEELKKPAYEMLCDFWGEDFVKQVEQEMFS